MVLKSTKQKTTYKNFNEKGGISYWLANFPTRKFPDQNKVAKNKKM